MKYNCLIVDDERPALKLLAAYLEKLPNLNLIASCENGLEAITAIQENTIDILYLDIQMPEFTGLDLLKQLSEKPQVILTTAYREYAVEGFALDVTDYLVKPFSLARFIQATNKATNNINQRAKLQSISTTPLLQPTATQDHFYVRTNHKMEKVVIQDILYIESMREYVSIHTNDRRYLVHGTMNRMEKELSSKHFARIHRSYIISLEHIKSITGNLVTIADKNIPVGASYRPAFFARINLL